MQNWRRLKIRLRGDVTEPLVSSQWSVVSNQCPCSIDWLLPTDYWLLTNSPAMGYSDHCMPPKLLDYYAMADSQVSIILRSYNEGWALRETLPACHRTGTDPPGATAGRSP